MVMQKKEQIISGNKKVSKPLKTGKYAATGINERNFVDQHKGKKNMADAVLFAEQRFRTLYYQSPIAIEHYDSDGKLIDVNPSALSLFGVMDMEKIKNFNLFDDPNISDEHKKKLKKNEVAHYQGPFDFDKVKKLKLYPTRKSGIIWLDVIITPLKDIHGVADGYLVQIIDITEHRKADEKLLKSEIKYRAIFENIQDVFIQTNLEGFIIEISPSIKYFSGYTRTELIGRNVSKIYFDLNDRLSIVKALKAKGEVRDFELKLKSKKGKVRHVSINARLIMDDEGNPIHIEGAIRDVEERKQSEILLLQTRQNYETFFNTIDEFLFVLDKQGNIVHTNKTIINRLGYKKGDLQGKSVLVLHPSEYSLEAGRVFDEILAGKTDFCPIPLITKSGLQIPAETKASHGFWNGKPAIFGVSKDISKVEFSEEKFSKVFHLNPSPCGLSDLNDRTYVEVNDAFYDLFGFDKDKDEVIGRTAWDLGIINKEKLNAIFKKADSNGRLINAEAGLKTKKGEIKQVLLSTENITVQDKKYRLTIVHDITERKKAVEALQKSEELFKSVVQNSMDLITLTDEKGLIIYLSPQCESVLGYPASKFIGQKMPDIIHPDDKIKCQQMWEQIFYHGQELNEFEYRIMDSLGKVRWIAHSARLIMNKEIKLGIQSTIRNITARKTAEVALRESEEKYRNIFENVQDVFYKADLKGNIIEISPSIKYFPGFDNANLVGSSVFDIYNDVKDRDIFLNALKKDGELRDYELILKTPTGEKRYVSVNARLVPDTKGHPICINGAIRDISQRKKAERIMQDVIAKNPMSIQLVGLDGFTLSVNPAHTRLFGTLPPKGFSIFKDPQLLEQGFGKLFKKIKKGEVVHFPDSYYNMHVLNPELPDVPIWLRVFAFPLIDNNGKPERFVFMHENITARKHAETALQESEITLSKAQHYAHLGSWELDDITHELRWSNETFRIFGYAPNSVNPTIDLFLQGVHPADRSCIQESLSAAWVSRTVFSEDHRIILPDGQERWVHEQAEMVCDHEKKPNKWIGTVQDITIRKRAEEGRERWANIFKNVQWGVAAINAEGTRFELMNPAFAKMHGATEEQLKARSVADVFALKVRSKLPRQFKLVNEKGHHIFESLHLRNDGSVFPVLIDATAIKDESGKVLYLAFNVQDITDRKKAEEDLKNSLDQLHQLTNHIEEVRENERVSISRELHDDLGQSLTAVKIDLGIINQHVSDSEVIAKINKVSALVSETIKTVQNISSKLRPQIIDDLGLAAGIDWYTKEFAQRNHIEVFLDIDPIIIIPPDASLIIFRIMQESLTNISRHAKATRVDISLRKTDRTFNFMISDNGIGIKEPQIKSNNSVGIIGMMERAASLGGTFTIYSENESGTTIKLILPIKNK
jgi:PAS domain S-box-containing protein